MITKVSKTPTFDKATKKLHAREIKTLDDAVREIMTDENIGVAKKGDLAGVFVHKFKINKQEILLSYTIINADELLLLALGSHENYCRDLKR